VREKFGLNAPGACELMQPMPNVRCGAGFVHARSTVTNLFDRKPIGPYTVDCICREARIIIEVDGGQHADNRHDLIRDQWLASHNYRVLRFWNNDVLANVAGVLETIATALADSPLTRLASDDARRPLPASGER
jgi:hypothetical protein